MRPGHKTGVLIISIDDTCAWTRPKNATLLHIQCTCSASLNHVCDNYMWPRPHPLDHDTCSLNFADTLLDPANPSWCVAGTALILSSTQYTRGVRAQCIHITVHGREYGGFPLVEHEQQLQLSFQLLAYSTSDGPTSHSNLVVFQWQRTQCHANEANSHTAKNSCKKICCIIYKYVTLLTSHTYIYFCRFKGIHTN